jgi:hypothetical protein
MQGSPAFKTSHATRQQCILMFLFLYLPYAYFNHSDGSNAKAES